jgi:deferrochelatase/peroxidase EfeB
MGFGVRWSKGQKNEFEIIDFGYNTATRKMLEALRDGLVKWDPGDPNRAELMELQRSTVLADLFERAGHVEAPAGLRQLADVHPAKVGFEAEVDRQLQKIHDSWFNRNGETQWIHDARLHPGEIEALMVQAKLRVCNLLLSGDARRCSWKGQCEWPEFFIQISRDDVTATAEVWVYGPDNTTPADNDRNTSRGAAKLIGSAGGMAGVVEALDLVGRVPDPDQEVPYVAAGPLRPITELRWRPAAGATAGATGSGPISVAPGGQARRPLLALAGPISSIDGAEVRAELAKVQGNILKSHGRPHSALLFLRFDDGPAARGFLAGLNVTTAHQQLETAEAFAAGGRVERPTDPTFVGLGLSATGYRALGRNLPADSVYRRGMKGTGRLTLDPPIHQWQPAYQGQVDAVLLLAHTHRDVLDRQVEDQLARSGADSVAVLTVERGDALYNAEGQRVEPFGFVDGVSQPLFFEPDLVEQLGVDDDGRARADGEHGWRQGFGPGQVLLADPDTDGYGSYLVFRKLEQNLRRFRAMQAELGAELGHAPDRAGAELIGRTPAGGPLPGALGAGVGPERPTADDAGAAAVGDFVFGTGSTCPVGAHVRRVNDRSGQARDKVMARRGLPYNEGRPTTADPPSGGVGLLFMACVWDLLHQFVEVQAGAVQPAAGSPDPLLGAGARWWADPLGQRRSVDLGEEPLVRLLGGEYFYLPPPAFLAGLGGAEAGS